MPSLIESLALAKRSLEGLATGDAFGEVCFEILPHANGPIELPKRTWRWTDDTHMALSIVETLKNFGRIDQDAVARAFARRYREEPNRGYGSGASFLLNQLAEGGDWRICAPALFCGGSFGNGAAMRAAPIGAFFSHDINQAAREAQLSAAVTHAHPEGQAGAIGVAVAAAVAAADPRPSGREFLEKVAASIPSGEIKRRVLKAQEIPETELQQAAEILGTGWEVSAQDTVPFCLWCAAHHLDDYEDALWRTAGGLGDSDTTCAIVGGIVALSAPAIPTEWLKRREPIPDL